jgi:Transposase DDE domain
MQPHLFNEVKKALTSLYSDHLQGHALARVNKLAGLVSGMITKKSCHLNALGSGIVEDINDASRETSAKRFVENGHTTYKVHFLPYLMVLLQSIIGKMSNIRQKNGTNHGLVFVMDGSQMGSKHVALMLCLVYQKRAIPICWVVRKGKKGHFPAEMHVALVQKAADILRPLLKNCPAFVNKEHHAAMPITLLGDGEFDSVDLQTICRTTLKWNYVFRTASDTLLYENGEQDSFQPKNIALTKGETFEFVPSLDFSATRFQDVHFLYWHDVGIHDKPIYLISNYDDPFDIIFYYKQRFSIETMFKDLKSRGFNLHETRLTKINALFNLIMIAALGYCLLFSLGERNKDHPDRKKVLRPHKNKPKATKVELSIFSFGIKLLQYFLDFDKPFVLSFQIE